MSNIDVADVGTARFFPEVLPSTVFDTIGASSAAAPLPADLRRFGVERLVQLRNLFLERDNDIRYTITADDFSIARNAGAVDDDIMDNQLNAFDSLTYRLFNENTGAAKTDYRTHFSILVDKPTVAQKLKFGIDLNQEEQQIDEDLGISNSVEKGVLPLPYSFKFEREYQVINSYTISSRISSVPTSGSGAVFEDISVNPNEAIILTEIGADPFAAADNFRIIIDRDNDVDYVIFHPFSLNSLNLNQSVFIPAIRELKFRALATNSISNADVRLVLKRIALTNTLRVRWGLISDSEAPGDLAQKVRGGVL
jgi:hypothetical protein